MVADRRLRMLYGLCGRLTGIVVEGRLRVLPDNPKGVFYRGDEALGVR